VIQNIGQSFKGFSKMSGTDKFGAVAGAAGQLGGLIGGTGGSALAGAAGGAMTGAAIGSIIPGIGTVIGGVVGGVAGAIGGFLSGQKAKNLTAEAKKVGEFLGGTVSVEQLKAMKEEAKAAGVEWKTFLAQQKKEIEARIKQRKFESAQQAQGFTQNISDKINTEGISEKLREALSAFVGKMADALGKFGLGIQDARLKDSKGFQAAAGVAGDVAGALGAASQAGIADVGLTAAASGAAAAIQEQAIAAAREAGLSDMEAAKQGSLAIAQILREQLNASIRSGVDLDANTQALLDEAKKNGITIMADPLVESLGVQKEMLGTLQQIAGQGGGSGKDRAAEAVQAAGGFGPTIVPNMGGGRGPLIQTHAGELVSVTSSGNLAGFTRFAGAGVGSLPALAGGGGAGAGSGGSVVNIYSSVNEDHLQTFEGRQQLRDHTVQTMFREAGRDLASSVAAGNA